MGELLRRLKCLFRRRRLDAELQEELQIHLEMKAEEFETSGMCPEEARFAARRHFGNVTSVRESSREFWGWRWLDDLIGDARVGLRMLARQRTMSLTALVSLALGIGAAITIFTVIHSVLLRPLPYRDPDRIATIWAALPDNPAEQLPPISDYMAWREHNSFFGEMAALLMSVEINLTGEGPPEWLQGQKATANLFPLLGVQPLLGRPFEPGDESKGAYRVAILSHALWQRRFGSDPEALGKTIYIDGVAHEVVGVMPQGFGIPDDKSSLWTPFDLSPGTVRDSPYHVRVLTRLAPGCSLETARNMARELAVQTAPPSWKDREKLVGGAMPLREMIVGPVRNALLPLGGAVGFLLMISFANVAGLLMAAGSERFSEMALRAAIGAGRGRLIRHYLTESMILSLAGCAAGLLLASFMVGPLVDLAPANMPRRSEIRLDMPISLLAIGLSLLAGALFGLFPAVAGSKPELIRWVQSAGLRATAGRSRQRTRKLLVAGQIAVALTLCTGAGLMIQSFRRLLAVDVGFDPRQVLTFQVRLAETEYASEINDASRGAGWSRVSPKAPARYREILDRLRTIPGVESASAISWLPLNTFFNEGRLFTIPDRPEPAPGAPRPGAGYNPVDVDFFRTLRVPLIRGRMFNRQDNADAPWSVIINETLARTWWPDRDPIGQTINYSGWGDPRPRQVVGIVKDIRHNRLSRDPQGQIYFPFQQLPPENHTNRVRSRLHMGFVVRTEVAEGLMVPRIRQEVSRVDKTLPVFAVQPMTRFVTASAQETQFITFLLGMLAVIALLLAAVGLYGVMSYAVAQRTREIGIRVALGARPGEMAQMVLGQAARLGMAGISAGLVISLALTGFLENILFSIKPTDPVTLVAVCLILAAAALAAGYFPARRASRVDPVVALRNE